VGSERKRIENLRMNPDEIAEAASHGARIEKFVESALPMNFKQHPALSRL
jgi:hypothetical protein